MPTSFLGTYLKDPYVAAIRPSSRSLARRIVRVLKQREVRTVVEYGPGSGAVTKPLLAALPEDGVYVAVERNPEFADVMRKIADPRLTVIEGSATTFDGAGAVRPGEADAVIASIPFSMLEPAERASAVANALTLLRDGGVCVIFHQYTPVMQPVLRRAFGNVRTMFEPRNVFPCFVFVSVKGEKPRHRYFMKEGGVPPTAGGKRKEKKRGSRGVGKRGSRS